MTKSGFILGTFLLAFQLGTPAALSHDTSCLRCTPSVAARMQAEARHSHKAHVHHAHRKHKAHAHHRMRKAVAHAYWHGYHDGYRAGAHAHRWHPHGHMHRKWVRLPRGKSYYIGHY